METVSRVLSEVAHSGRKPVLVLDNVDSIENLLHHPEGPVRIVLNKILEMANSDLINVVLTANVATSKLQLDDGARISQSPLLLVKHIIAYLSLFQLSLGGDRGARSTF